MTGFLDHRWTKLGAFILVVIAGVLGFRSLQDQQGTNARQNRELAQALAKIQSTRLESCLRGNTDRATLRGLLHESLDPIPGAADDLVRLDKCYGPIDCEARITGKKEPDPDPVCEEILRKYATDPPGPASFTPSQSGQVALALAATIEPGP